MPVGMTHTPASGVNKSGAAAQRSRPAEPGEALMREEVEGRRKECAGKGPAVVVGFGGSRPGPSIPGQNESGEAESAGPRGDPCSHFPGAS